MLSSMQFFILKSAVTTFVLSYYIDICQNHNLSMGAYVTQTFVVCNTLNTFVNIVLFRKSYPET